MVASASTKSTGKRFAALPRARSSIGYQDRMVGDDILRIGVITELQRAEAPNTRGVGDRTEHDGLACPEQFSAIGCVGLHDLRFARRNVLRKRRPRAGKLAEEVFH